MLLGTGLLGTGAFISPSASAQDRPKANDAGAAAVLFSCQSIIDDGRRLECYDREVGALQDAQANKDVVIVDQEEIRKTRRNLFGFSLPKIALFQRGDDVEEEIREIDDTLGAFSFGPRGRAQFTLSNGARWIQTDNLPVLGKPKVGDKVRIESAAFGSFKASIEGRRAVRVKRLN